MDFGSVEEEFEDEESNKLQSTRGKRFVATQKVPIFLSWMD